MIYSTTAELDYVGVPFNVTFVESSTQSVAISVLDDDLIERPEMIQLLLTTLIPNVILADPNSAQVEITDDDSEIYFNYISTVYKSHIMWVSCTTDAVFQFSMMYYSVSEDSGVVSICLELINGTLTEDIIIQVMVVNNNNGMSGCKWSVSMHKRYTLNVHGFANVV